MRISRNPQPKLSQLAMAARLAIGGRVVMRAPAKPPQAVPAKHRAPPSAGPRQGASVRRRRRQAGSDAPHEVVVPRSAFGAPVVMPPELLATFGPAPEVRVSAARSADPATDRRMTDGEKIAARWRSGTPLSELRADYGALADEVVRSLMPDIGWRRAA